MIYSDFNDDKDWVSSTAFICEEIGIGRNISVL